MSVARGNTPPTVPLEANSRKTEFSETGISEMAHRYGLSQFRREKECQVGAASPAAE